MNAKEPLQPTEHPGRVTALTGVTSAASVNSMHSMVSTAALRMKSQFGFIRFTLTGAICALFAGCLFKPTTIPTRSFVLTPVSASEHPSGATKHLPIGVGLVKMPPYLMKTPMAVRHNANEITYLEDSLWAEHLDNSFQRALAANLAALLPTDQVRLSVWQRDEVALAVYVAVEQFDIDIQGCGTLIAWWRIITPGTGRVIKSGQSRFNRQGPPPYADPQTMAATLSELTGEFSQTLADAIRESVPAGVAGN
jgi:uncharacterized lipoprotein YmbA